jgi:hypothetical protein
VFQSITIVPTLDDAVKGLEESQLTRESIGYEAADKREVAGDELDSASDADEDGGGSSGAPPLLLLASEGEALGSASPSPLPLHHSGHSPSFLGSLSSLANAAQLAPLEDPEANRHVSSFLSL